MREREVRGEAPIGASTGLTINAAVDSSFKESRAEGDQNLILARRKHELQAQTATHKQFLERMKLEHELEETRKDNDARRAREVKQDVDKQTREQVIFRLALAGIVIAFALSCVAVLVVDDEVISRWGQSVFALIVGGFVGYFTGRNTAS